MTLRARYVFNAIIGEETTIHRVVGSNAGLLAHIPPLSRVQHYLPTRGIRWARRHSAKTKTEVGSALLEVPRHEEATE